MKLGHAVVILVVLWFTWFWISIFRQMIPLLLPDMAQQLQLSVTATSIIITLSLLGQSTSALFAGSLSKFLGMKNTIVLGVAFTFIALLLVTFTRVYSFILFLFFISGLGAGLYLPNAISFLSYAFSTEKRGDILVYTKLPCLPPR